MTYNIDLRYSIVKGTIQYGTYGKVWCGPWQYAVVLSSASLSAAYFVHPDLFFLPGRGPSYNHTWPYVLGVPGGQLASVSWHTTNQAIFVNLRLVSVFDIQRGDSEKTNLYDDFLCELTQTCVTSHITRNRISKGHLRFI